MSDIIGTTVETATHTGCLRWRLVFAVLGALGMAIVYGLNVNLSFTIVTMINHTDLSSIDKAVEAKAKHGTRNKTVGILCYNVTSESENATSSEDGPFSWTEPQQGLVLGSYFWGYLITQIPGGRFAEMFGGKWLFFAAVILNMTATLLSPVCSYAGYQYLIIMRFLEGLGGGVSFPAMNVLISKWAPPEERSTIASIVFSGTAMGTVISIPTSGLIAAALGWEAVFYIHGGLVSVWCILWIVFVTDEPEDHKFISQAENDYIAASLHHVRSKKKHHPPAVPWKAIVTSVPFWAILFSHVLNNFGWYMFLVELPMFMRNGLGFNIKQNAGLSCLPFLCNWIFSICYSEVLDWARHKHYISTTNARKLSMSIASLVPAGCLIGVCLSGCDREAVVTLMVVATMFYGAMFSGVFANHCDIANNFAGLLMGMTNMVATIPGFVVPIFVGTVTFGQPGVGPWHIVFYTTAGLLVLEFVLYSLMASGEEQIWNTPKTERATADAEHGDNDLLDANRSGIPLREAHPDQ